MEGSQKILRVEKHFRCYINDEKMSSLSQIGNNSLGVCFRKHNLTHSSNSYFLQAPIHSLFINNVFKV